MMHQHFHRDHTHTRTKDTLEEQTSQTSHKNKLTITLHLIETVKLQYPLQTFQDVQIITLFSSELPL